MTTWIYFVSPPERLLNPKSLLQSPQNFTKTAIPTPLRPLTPPDEELSDQERPLALRNQSW